MRRFDFIILALALLGSGQVFWWGYIIVSQQEHLASVSPSLETRAQVSKYRKMIFAEGAFFIFSLSLGLWYARQSHREQTALRKAHTDFLGAVTHELKTPLANIRLALETLERTGLSPETQRRYLARAQNATDQLLFEIESILAMSQAEAKKAPLQTIHLNSILEMCLEKFDEAALGSVVIENKIETDLFVESATDDVRLALQCALDNAIKYSSPQTNDSKKLAKVEISATSSENGKRLFLKIRDYGVGLTPEEIKKAFDPFWRADTSIKEAKGGTGLGLTLARRLGQRSNFQIRINSEGKGHGTLVEFEFASDQKAVA